MPFTKAASIGRVILIAQAESGDTALSSATITFDVLDATGNAVATRHHDLLGNLTTAQKTSIFSLLTVLKTKLAAEAV